MGEDLQISDAREARCISLMEIAEAPKGDGSWLTGGEVHWRYLLFATLQEESRCAAMADFVGNNESLEFSNSSVGGGVAVVGEILEEQNKISEAEDVDYELKFIEVPGVLVEALWLSPIGPKQGRGEIFVPFKKSPVVLQLGEEIAKQEFVNRVEAEVERRLEIEQNSVRSLLELETREDET